MTNPHDFDPYEYALQHIVLTLVGVLAHAQTAPDQWLMAFRGKVAESLDGWFPHDVPDHSAEAYRNVTKEAATALLNCISLRPPQFPPASDATGPHE